MELNGDQTRTGKPNMDMREKLGQGRHMGSKNTRHRDTGLTSTLCNSLSLRCHAHKTLAKRLMHMAHKSGNTSGVSNSSSDWLNYTGFPGDVCVAFFNVPHGNKDAVTPNPLTKEESRRVYNCDDKRLSGSNKRWIFKSM